MEMNEQMETDHLMLNYTIIITHERKFKSGESFFVKKTHFDEDEAGNGSKKLKQLVTFCSRFNIASLTAGKANKHSP